MRTARSILIATLAIAAAGVSACGFSPMYASGSSVNAMREIRVETGVERIDFLLQEALIDQMGARDASGTYVLRTVTESDSTPLGIGADAIARRFAIRITVEYQLLRTGDADPVITGRASAEASYDVTSAVYGSVTAERDAEARAAEAAADRIIAQLARAFQDSDQW